MADFIGGGLPTVAPSAASHTDPNATSESPAPITTLEPPASNPGVDDPSAGIAKDAGGTSGSAYVGSPVTQEHESNKTVVGTVLETVFGKKERTADEFESSTTTTTTSISKENSNTANLASTTENDTAATGTGAPGVLGAVAGAAAAGTAAVASYVGLGNSETTPKEEGDKTAASVEKSAAETEAVASEKANEAVESAKEATTTTTEKSKDDSEAKDADDGVNDGSEPKKVSDHEAATRENVDAIPTAGGEKLGTAHEGESKVIPDLPPVDPSADETKVGQPDKTTADNTAKNVGDATAPATSNTTAGTTAHREESSPSGKPKFLDRVKAKLHLDKKDKA